MNSKNLPDHLEPFSGFRLAVQSNIFPLYELEDGVTYTINVKGNRPVTDYLKIQGRFKHLTDDDFDKIQHMVDKDWKILLRKTSHGDRLI
jgi:2-oxoisovalerate ferredoxin oxidoreductase beta subunit